MDISFTLNGKNVISHSDPGRRLIDLLREDFFLPAQKRAAAKENAVPAPS